MSYVVDRCGRGGTHAPEGLGKQWYESLLDVAGEAGAAVAETYGGKLAGDGVRAGHKIWTGLALKDKGGGPVQSPPPPPRPVPSRVAYRSPPVTYRPPVPQFQPPPNTPTTPMMATVPMTANMFGGGGGRGLSPLMWGLMIVGVGGVIYAATRKPDVDVRRRAAAS